MITCQECGQFFPDNHMHLCNGRLAHLPAMGDTRVRGGTVTVWDGTRWTPVVSDPAASRALDAFVRRETEWVWTAPDSSELAGAAGQVLIAPRPKRSDDADVIFSISSTLAGHQDWDLDHHQLRQKMDEQLVGEGVNRRMFELMQQAIAPATDATKALETSAMDAGAVMRKLMAELMSTTFQEQEKEAEKVVEGLGALGVVLRRRPIRLDARTEVIVYMHRELAGSAPVEPWRTGAYFGGTTIYEDNELEPGVVRAHFYVYPVHPEQGVRSLIETQEIVIGDL